MHYLKNKTLEGRVVQGNFPLIVQEQFTDNDASYFYPFIVTFSAVKHP